MIPRVALTATNIAAPITTPQESEMVFNTNTTSGANAVYPGYYYWNGSRWIMVGQTPPIDSVSITDDVTISSLTYTPVSGTTLTFTAHKENVLVTLSASGYGYTNSMSFLSLRVYNSTDSNVVGGTNEKIQSFDFLMGTVTTWSCSFSKTLTGLTIGNTYTLNVEGMVSGISGVYDAVINSNSNPDNCHLTLSVIQ